MEVENVIKQVATLLQLTNVMEADFENFENLDVQTKKDINLILSSINEVLCDVATEYLPLKKSESITVSGGEFDLTTLTNFYKLLSVKTNNEYTLDFETLKIDDGTYKIEYMHLPEIYEIDDEITEFDSRLTTYNLAYGVAGEFCIISGNYSEAEMWNSKFLNAMEDFKKPHKVAKLKTRRWL